MRITVRANSGEFGFACGEHERLLYAGLAQGLRLPYECATGTCGTCRGRILEGSTLVEWSGAPGFARLKREKGDVLMCQTRPTSDVVVRVPANVTTECDDASRPAWQTGRIANLRRLNRDMVDFELELTRPLSFAAGQFVVLEVPEVSGARAYSMVNFDEESASIKLLIKRKPDGRFSDWVFDQRVDGREAGIFGPLGRATFHPEEGRNLLLIAGGSGIAGMMSILERARRAHYFRDHCGYLFFGVRRLEEAVYLERFCEHVAAACGKLEVTLALSEETVPGQAHPQWPLLRLADGMVTDAAARAMAGRYDNLVSFVAGPTPMVDKALRLLIRDARQPALWVRYDKFT